MPGYLGSSIATTFLPAGSALAILESGASEAVLSKSADYTLVLTDRTAVIRATDDMILTLPDATAAGNGFFINFEAAGGALTLRSAGSDTINGVTADVIVPDGGWGSIVSNGADYLAKIHQPTISTNVTAYTLYGSSEDRAILALDTAFTTTKPNQQVNFSGNLNIEASHNSMLYIKIDGTEVGSGDTAGIRFHGIAPFNYDRDNANTMFIVSFQYTGIVASVGAHTLTIHARGDPATLGLNGVVSDSNIDYNERGSSNIRIEVKA